MIFYVIQAYTTVEIHLKFHNKIYVKILLEMVTQVIFKQKSKA